MDDKKIIYLQMIQQAIDRMSGNAALYKGFSAAMVTGATVAAYRELNIWLLLLSMLPVLAFFSLDTYYLSLERRYRFLYDQVRTDEHPVDFAMKPSGEPFDLLRAKARFLDCIKSPAIYRYYLIVGLFMVGLCCYRIIM